MEIKIIISIFPKNTTKIITAFLVEYIEN